jgi:PEP-CTERM motif
VASESWWRCRLSFCAVAFFLAVGSATAAGAEDCVPQIQIADAHASPLPPPHRPVAHGKRPGHRPALHAGRGHRGRHIARRTPTHHARATLPHRRAPRHQLLRAAAARRTSAPTPAQRVSCQAGAIAIQSVSSALRGPPVQLLLAERSETAPLDTGSPLQTTSGPLATIIPTDFQAFLEPPPFPADESGGAGCCASSTPGSPLPGGPPGFAGWPPAGGGPTPPPPQCCAPPGGPPPLAAPEPSTWALAILGFLAIGAALRRRRTTDCLPATDKLYRRDNLNIGLNRK